jgi:hypothetical protein
MGLFLFLIFALCAALRNVQRNTSQAETSALRWGSTNHVLAGLLKLAEKNTIERLAQTYRLHSLAEVLEKNHFALDLRE